MKDKKICYLIDSNKNLFTIYEDSMQKCFDKIIVPLDIVSQIANDNNEELMQELKTIFKTDNNTSDYELKLERTILNALDKIRKYEKDFDYFDTLCELSQNELTNSECISVLDRGNYSQEIINNLNAIKKDLTNYNYDLETDFSNFVNYIKIGQNYTEKVQIFIMCYVANVKLKELTTWGLRDIIEYIKETDEDFYKDKQYIIECLDLIDKNWTYSEDLKETMEV